jgi:hypothetical protein
MPDCRAANITLVVIVMAGLKPMRRCIPRLRPLELGNCEFKACKFKDGELKTSEYPISVRCVSFEHRSPPLSAFDAAGR